MVDYFKEFLGESRGGQVLTREWIAITGWDGYNEPVGRVESFV